MPLALGGMTQPVPLLGRPKQVPQTRWLNGNWLLPTLGSGRLGSGTVTHLGWQVAGLSRVFTPPLRVRRRLAHLFVLGTRHVG